MAEDQEDVSIRDSLAAAFDKSEASTESSTDGETSSPENNASESATDVAAVAGDNEVNAEKPPEVETGKEVKDGKPLAELEQKAEKKPLEKPAQTAGTKPTTLHVPTRLPPSWKPALKDEWAKLPPSVKAEVMRRERDIDRGLQDASEARKFASKFQDITRPYEAFIRMESSDPLGAFENYLKTGAILRQGTAQEKAYSIAQVIKNFNIDPYMLDQALVGALKQPAPQPAEYKDPRVDQMLQQAEEMRQAQQAQLYEESQTEIDVFRASGEAEFFDDVEDLMADILSLSAKRGIEMSLQEAYKRATMIHPEVKEELERRGAQSTITARTQAVLAARKKAVNAGEAPRIGGAAPTVNGSIRADIEAAIDRVGHM